MFALLILLSQKQDPSRNESYNLIKMCKCVGIYFFVWRMDELLCMIHLSSLFFLDVPYLSLFFSFDMPCGHVAYLLWVCIFFSLFFLTCLSGMWHTFFGYAFFISLFFFVFIVHILDGHFREKESWYDMEFYFMGGWQCLLSSSVEV